MAQHMPWRQLITFLKRCRERPAVGLVVAIALALVIALAAAPREPSPSAVGTGRPGQLIEVRDDGFRPARAEVRRGDAVTFVNMRDVHVWPASDPHPTHARYPEFDAGEPIAPGGRWTFRFERAGEWTYHDHLAPYYTATIIVSDDRAAENTEGKNCREEEASSACWQEIMLGVFRRDGLTAAFDELAALYRRYPHFASSCHYLAHNLGIAAYGEYLRSPERAVAANASACASGFYHGFMEAFLTAKRDPLAARNFCRWLGREIGPVSPDDELQCFHGIGHGALETAVAASGRAEGGEEDLIAPAITLCERAAESDAERYRCASGVYNAIANAYQDGEYGLTVRREDPAWLCRKQAAQYRESCYGNMNTAFAWIGGDFPKAAALAARTVEGEYLGASIRYLAALHALAVARAQPGTAVLECRALSANLRAPCIEGFAHGFLEHGTPGIAYREALDFCGERVMTDAERTTCYRYVLSNLTGWYPRETARAICGEVRADLQKYCQNRL